MSSVHCLAPTKTAFQPGLPVDRFGKYVLQIRQKPDLRFSENNVFSNPRFLFWLYCCTNASSIQGKNCRDISKRREQGLHGAKQVFIGRAAKIFSESFTTESENMLS